MIPIIYHPKYNITVFGLERLHPFDGLKYRRIHEALIADGIRKPADFTRPPPIRREDLERVHTPEYLDFLEHIHARWQRIPDASEEVIPNIHPIARCLGTVLH